MNKGLDRNKIMQISSESDLQIFEIGSVGRTPTNARGTPTIMFFTPQHKDEVPQQNSSQYL